MPINYFANAFNQLPQVGNMSNNGFSMKPKRNPFRALSFEQEPVEQPSFQEAYPRERMSDYERFLMQGAPRQEDHQRSKGAKIAAALLSGLGGYLGDGGATVKNTNNALMQPYERAMNEYELEGGRLKELSSIETARTNQDRLALKAIQDYELAKADDDRAERTLSNTIRNTDSLVNTRGKSVRRNELTGEDEII